MLAKFEGNLIMHLHFMAVFFASVQRERKKTKKMSDFFKAYILGTVGMIYFRSGIYSLPMCQRLYSKFGFVWSRDHGATIVICSLCYYTHVVHTYRFLRSHDR